MDVIYPQGYEILNQLQFLGGKNEPVNLSDPSQEWQEEAGDGSAACIFYKQPQPPHSGFFS